MTPDDLLTIALMFSGAALVIFGVGNILVDRASMGVFFLLLGGAVLWLAFMQLVDPGLLATTATGALFGYP